MRSPPFGTKLVANLRVARERGRALITGGNGEALGRFLAACREDPRIVAAFLVVRTQRERPTNIPISTCT